MSKSRTSPTISVIYEWKMKQQSKWTMFAFHLQRFSPRSEVLRPAGGGVGPLLSIPAPVWANRKYQHLSFFHVLWLLKLFYIAVRSITIFIHLMPERNSNWMICRGIMMGFSDPCSIISQNLSESNTSNWIYFTQKWLQLRQCFRHSAKIRCGSNWESSPT